jgi:hypothetical protein
MLRTSAICLLIWTTLTVGGVSQAAPAAPPLVYEVQINGESFLIELDRMVRLESSEKPGVSYNVAVRVSPKQRVRLNTIQFDYALPAKVEDDGKRENRSARLTHELGFSILLTDLGQPLDGPAQEQTLRVLRDSVTRALREEKVATIDVSTPRELKLRESTARGVVVRRHEASKMVHIYLAYVLTGPKFSASCVAEYVDRDGEDVLPLIKETLDSVRAR